MFDRSMFARLLALNVGVAQPDNARALDMLSKNAPMSIYRYASGSEHNAWIVPDAWSVLRATIATEDGHTLFDGSLHPLAVAGYSSSFTGIIDKAALDRHIYYSQRFPDAYAFYSLGNYRPWLEHWGFCVPWSIYSTWEYAWYRIDLVTERTPGEMVVAELSHPGRSSETVMFNAHTCHPCQANDDLIGEFAVIELFKRLHGRETKYSYLGILAPEHVGTVFHAKRLADEGRLHRIVAGLFLEMLGTSTPLALQQSFGASSIIDRVAEYAIRTVRPDARIAPYRTVVGNDESVWEAPGIEIPTISISRWPYDQYHTSSDDLTVISDASYEEAVAVVERMISILETDVTIHRNYDGLIALSNPRYALYIERPDPVARKELTEMDLRFGAMQDRLQRHFDGRTTAFAIAEHFGVPFEDLLAYLERFEAAGLVELRPVASLAHYATSRPISGGTS